ncbi:MAG: allantoicase [Saprospiraceae bacterium]|nr:allantoicase [Saprospiraceae bacterium]
MSTQHQDHLDRLSSQYLDLAAQRLGGAVLYATDDFFAEKENLIKPGRGIFIPDKYTDRGKWMDGWESRRRRDTGHDWAVVRLATQGRIRGFDIDTNHFLGNHPPFASIDAIHLRANEQITEWDKLPWREILPRSPLAPGSQNPYLCADEGIYNHVRLHIYPDGGVARLRVYGEVSVDWKALPEDREVDLAAAIHGARALGCSDMFFSKMSNLLMPGRGINMGDGWETRRSRDKGHTDWVIIRLATAGQINRIVLDTAHFKGNYPDRCIVEACFSEDDAAVLNGDVAWHALTSEVKLEPDTEHEISCPGDQVVTHARLTIIPDGGVSRLRLFGKPARS